MAATAAPGKPTVDELVGMGFPRDLAEAAIKRHSSTAACTAFILERQADMERKAGGMGSDGEIAADENGVQDALMQQLLLMDFAPDLCKESAARCTSLEDCVSYCLDRQRGAPAQGGAAGSESSAGVTHGGGLRFRIDCKTQFGETAAVVGSTPELGSWDLKHAVRLATGPESYPIWTSPEIPIEGIDLEFKFVILRHDGSLASWEPFFGNRHLRAGQVLGELQFGMAEPEGKGDGETFVLDGMYWRVRCPHEDCGLWFEVRTDEVNCTIFRHGIFKATGHMLDPHSSQQTCEDAMARDELYGCGKPVRFNPGKWRTPCDVVTKGSYTD